MYIESIKGSFFDICVVDIIILFFDSINEYISLREVCREGIVL